MIFRRDFNIHNPLVLRKRKLVTIYIDFYIKISSKWIGNVIL